MKSFFCGLAWCLPLAELLTTDAENVPLVITNLAQIRSLLREEAAKAPQSEFKEL